ncbi:hypothetical protein TKK_0001681 [Trichogramma kaykai]
MSSDDEFTPKSKLSWQAVLAKDAELKKELSTKTKSFASNYVGRKFKTDQEVLDAIAELQSHLEVFVQRDEQPKTALKTISRVTKNPNVSRRIYVFTRLNAKPKAKDFEKLSNSRKLGCPSHLTFKLSEDGSHYQMDAILEHEGHALQFKAAMLPPVRPKLNEENVKFVKDSLRTGGSNMKILLDLHKAGINAGLKNITNIKYAAKQAQPSSFDDVIKLLDAKNAIYDFSVDENNSLEGLFVSTPSMKHTYEIFPEILMIDATYGLLDQDYPLVIAAIVDGNGITEVIAFGLVAQETEESYSWFIDCIINHLPGCKQTVAFVSDKDMVLRKVIKEKLELDTYICTFHVLQAFKRAVTFDKMAITKSEKKTVIKFVSDLTYAIDEEAYNCTYQKFIDVAPSPAIEYFNKNWHSIKREWVRCFMNNNFKTDTNNRVESFNSKLKAFFQGKSSVPVFLESFFDFLSILDSERSQDVLKMFTTVPTYSMDEVNAQYFHSLTNYAYDFIEDQLILANQTVIVRKIGTDMYSIHSNSCKNLEYTVSPHSCSCRHFKSMQLPCKHIFKIRKQLKLPSFDLNLCAQRWTKVYYSLHHKIFQSDLQDRKITGLAQGPSNQQDAPDELPKEQPPSHHSDVCFNPTTNGTEVDTSEKFIWVCTESSSSVEMTFCDSEDEAEIPKNRSSNRLSSNPICENINQTSSTFASKSLSIQSDIDAEIVGTTTSSLVPPSKSVGLTEDKVLRCNDISSNITPEEPPAATFSKPQLRSSSRLRGRNDAGHSLFALKKTIAKGPKATAGTSSITFKKTICKGRKKGTDKTVIGSTKRKFVGKPYSELGPKLQALFLLKMLVPKEILENKIIGEELITENEINFNQLPCSFFDSSIDVSVLEPYICLSAYKRLCVEKIEKSEDLVLWLCGTCNLELDGKAIFCNQCVNWFHITCQGVTKKQLEKFENTDLMYFCIKCKANE